MMSRPRPRLPGVRRHLSLMSIRSRHSARYPRISASLSRLLTWSWTRPAATA